MFAARFPGYRLKRWPDWDPDAERWEPWALWEMPRNRRQAFLGAGLTGLRWRRRHFRAEALMTAEQICGEISDRLDIIAGRPRRLSDEERESRRAWTRAPERVLIGHRLRCRLWGSVFWVHELSDDTDLAAEVVSEAAADPDSGLEELAPGFWVYGVPPSKTADPDIGHMTLSHEYIGLRYAGPGSGFASMHALNRVGWTTQMTAKTRLAVMAGTPEPLHPTVVHEPRHNPARRDLTWAEITFLEALRTLDMAEKPVERIICELKNAMTLRALGPNAAIRQDRVASAWDVEMQPHPPSSAQSGILAAMPATLSSCNLFAGRANRRSWEQI
ncbi:hypothetical protein [Candidatus Poriferisodalis sp.]|uniref:hypothetical protein n=1 Tax=Candidatus Poriferisodalis sp. TaxID=3101277 RepID=UPI003B01C5FF